MSNSAKHPRQNRTITVDFNSEATYHRLCLSGPRFIDFVTAFILSIGLKLKHKCDCSSERLTRHSHYARLRLDGLTIWRIQCTGCRAVFTVLPHFVLRYRQMRAEVAKKALLATHGGFSFRDLCRDRKRVPDGHLSVGLFDWTYQFGATADPLSSTVAPILHRG